MKELNAASRLALALVTTPSLGLAWGHEGHEVIALIAEHYLSPPRSTGAILGGASLEDVASWADDYRRDHPETGPRHYINITSGSFSHRHERGMPRWSVRGRRERFLAVLRDPKADQAPKAEALEFVVHFIGDLHLPLHDEDNGDKGGNTRQVVFDGHSDNLHWVWDTGLLQHIGRSRRVQQEKGTFSVRSYLPKQSSSAPGRLSPPLKMVHRCGPSHG